MCFNLHLGLSGMFENLCGWVTARDAHLERIDEYPNPNPNRIDDYLAPPPASSLSSSCSSSSSSSSGAPRVTVLPSAQGLVGAVLASALRWLAQVAPKDPTLPEFQHAKIVQPDGRVVTYYPFLCSRREDSAIRGGHSFHLFTQRFLAHAIQECCKNPFLADFLCGLDVVGPQDLGGKGLQPRVMQPFILFPSGATPTPLPVVLPVLVDHPLDCLAWAAEIRAGMWRRNGVSVSDQLMNYEEVPYCRVFRDLDLLVVQFFAARTLQHTRASRPHSGDAADDNQSREEGPPLLLPLVARILHRFDLLAYVQTDGMSDAAANSLLSPMERPTSSVMLEEALSLLTLVVTELPRECPPLLGTSEGSSTPFSGAQAGASAGPAAGDSASPTCPHEAALQARILEQTRRELIHRLCASSATFSKLVECAALVSDHSRLPAPEVEALIRAVSAAREPASLGSLDPPQLTLRPELWCEYDPLFLHLHPRQHQEALERRPPITQPCPMVPPMHKEHRMFNGLRRSILSDPLLLQALRTQVLAFAARASPPRPAAAATTAASRPNTDMADYSDTEPQNLKGQYHGHIFAVRCDESLWARVLHLLTLMAHDLDASGQHAQHSAAWGADGPAGTSNTPIVNPNDAHAQRLAAWLMEPVAVKSRQHASLLRYQPGEVNPCVAPGHIGLAQAQAWEEEGSGGELGGGLWGGLGATSPASAEGEVCYTLPSVLCALIDVFECPPAIGHGSHEDCSKHWLAWLIARLSALSPAAQVYAARRAANRSVEERVRVLERRKELAKQRSMELVRARAASFALATTGLDSEEEDELDEASARGGGGNGQPNGGVEEEEVLCIICHTNDRDERLGVQMLCQTSVLCCGDPNPIPAPDLATDAALIDAQIRLVAVDERCSLHNPKPNPNPNP